MAATKRYCIYEFFAEIGDEGRGSVFVLCDVNCSDGGVDYGIAFSPDAPNMVVLRHYNHVPTYAEAAMYEASEAIINDVKCGADQLEAVGVAIDDREVYDGEDRQEWMEFIIKNGGKKI